MNCHGSCIAHPTDSPGRFAGQPPTKPYSAAGPQPLGCQSRRPGPAVTAHRRPDEAADNHARPANQPPTRSGRRRSAPAQAGSNRRPAPKPRTKPSPATTVRGQTRPERHRARPPANLIQPLPTPAHRQPPPNREPNPSRRSRAKPARPSNAAAREVAGQPGSAASHRLPQAKPAQSSGRRRQPGRFIPLAVRHHKPDPARSPPPVTGQTWPIAERR
jgi:hypothetical protein